MAFNYEIYFCGRWYRTCVLLCLLGFVVQLTAVVVIPPYYNFSSLYRSPPVPELAGVDYLSKLDFIQYHENACLSHTNMPKHSVNKATNIHNISEEIQKHNYLSGTTYWWNEYMHVGHVTFDIVLMQLLRNVKIDRIIFQRAACNANLCAGIGTVRSFYSAYFGAIQEAFQPNVPLFIRYTWHEKAVTPMFVSTEYDGYELEINKHGTAAQKELKPIHLGARMCFEKVIRRGSAYHGNYYGSVAPENIELFKRKAYASRNIQMYKPLTPYFNKDPPYVILFSYRGVPISRSFKNTDHVISSLQTAFRDNTKYIFRSHNNGNASHTAEYQIATVASANVIITNHGAFEGNLIYMRNGSLLIELSGSYHNPEFRFFQHLAHMFGVFYTRIQTNNLIDHQQSGVDMQESEITEVVDAVKQYFDLKPFLFNTQ